MSLKCDPMEQAIILAGGQATRMRPYTDDRPKAMVEVAGAPIIEHQIKWLHQNGVKLIVVSCGYRAEVIQDHVGDGSSLGVSVTYAREDEPLGRGGGLKFAGRRLPKPSDRWLAMNGDVLTDRPVADLEEHHVSTGAIATIALAQYRSSWGIADLDGNLIRGFLEKPALPYWINAGIYCFDPELVDMLPDLGDHEDTTFPELAKAGKLVGFRITGRWRGIDTAKDVLEAGAELSG